MLRDGSCESQMDNAATSAGEVAPWWQTVNAALVDIAKRRAGLDAEEARWLREAEQIQIWKPYGMVSMVDYLERVCGYEPRTAQHRMRVANALGNLPELNDALASGELCFSAVRELVRVATPATEGEWREAARDKNLRQIEDLVAGHQPGELPDDPVEEAARLHSLSFHEITASTYALFRQARQVLDAENGSRLSDTEVIALFANSILDGNQSNNSASAPTSSTTLDSTADASRAQAPVIDGVQGRARSQICYSVCRVCDRGWQEGAGRRIPITLAELERARCDAQHIGDIDSDTPAKAVQDIPPATVRLIWARDCGVCQTPGCRSTIGLEIHHILARAAGGGHDPSNLTLRCSSCHTAHHEGRLRISGTAPHALITQRTNSPGTPIATQAQAAARPRDAVVGANASRRGRTHSDRSTSPRGEIPTDTKFTPGSDIIESAPGAPAHAGGSFATTARKSPLRDAEASPERDLDTNLPGSGGVPPLSAKYAAVARRTEAVTALRTLGWSPAIAKNAVDTALALVRSDEPLEGLLLAAIRACPRRGG